MIALIASFFSLCIGPLIYQFFGPLKRTDKIVSGIVVTVVIITIAFEIIPQAYQVIGLLALILVLIGFLGPSLIERTFQRAADTTHKLTIYLGILGLLIHAMLDGTAIQANQSESSYNMTLAIILHRLPIGLTIWWLLQPLLGKVYALITLIVIGLFTIAGFLLSQTFNNFHDHLLFALLQSFISGSLLHVVIHKPHADGCMHTSEVHSQHAHHENTTQSVNDWLFRWETLGILIGIVLLAVINYCHQ